MLSKSKNPRVKLYRVKIVRVPPIPNKRKNRNPNICFQTVPLLLAYNRYGLDSACICWRIEKTNTTHLFPWNIRLACNTGEQNGLKQ